MKIYPVLGGDDPFWPGRCCIDSDVSAVLISFANYPKVFTSLSTEPSHQGKT
jgi:hypothetical protein